MARLRVDAVAPGEARALLRTCCGSSRWVERMMARIPFGGPESLQAAAREEWFALTRDDWIEAFRHHPKIGDVEGLRRRFADTRHLAAQEQAGVAGAPEDVLAALAAGNAEYQNKFGYIFIVCASGLTAAEMLKILRARLANDPESELLAAAEEQAKITALRLNNL
ncbi:MAG TPA: 2-oxo-4-hydroxy-4-carboxy-5-ureidoimidazoline decarboxylase [Vicinamibacterales bacterium]|nr:2-oxo-4-hydroxy-4-carboxy-5-ureidoimidazoline decarboxylase [Vicinamibacterales bacterium]